jgi:hypothetical protein
VGDRPPHDAGREAGSANGWRSNTASVARYTNPAASGGPTAGSVSTWATTPTASPDGELRIVRTGAVFDLYWRPDALASWLLIQSFVRADMPATLHVGLMIYATEAPPSIRASFDEIALF